MSAANGKAHPPEPGLLVLLKGTNRYVEVRSLITWALWSSESTGCRHGIELAERLVAMVEGLKGQDGS